MSAQRVVILGGGLAGLAAAVALRPFDVHITLIESANRLGGRATSFTDPATARRIDNCQHVVLGCCTNLMHFYRQLGVDHLIDWHDTHRFADANGRIHTLKPSSLFPAPIHYAPSMMKMSAFTLAQRLSIAKAMRSIMAIDLRQHTDKTFAALLTQLGQSTQTIRRFWNVVIVSACNLDVHRVQASTALFVFQQGFLAHPKAALLGLPSCPLVELYDPAHKFIDDLRLGRRVTAIRGTQSIESIRLDDDSTLTAEYFIFALPMHSAASLCDQPLLDFDPRLTKAQGLTFSPILGVHLEFDRSVSDHPHIAFLDAPTQWVFFKDHGRRAHAVISAADEWMTRSQSDIIDAVLRDLQTVAPNAGREVLKVFHVVKEKRATFAATVGHDAHRPSTAGAVANLFMAGDYCDSLWPATMEGAVQSGYRAASAIIGQDLTRSPLKPATLYRMLSAGANTR